MTARHKNLLIAFGLVLVVIGFGTLDDWFATPLYDADGIAYIDNAAAIRHSDWMLALNPYWSIGYPFALAAMRWMFPFDWAGEWIAVHVTNLVIFIAAYVSFLYFIQQAVAYAAGREGALESQVKSAGLFVAGSLIFVGWQAQTKEVSRMTPDLMVSGLFFLLTAFSLQFCRRPTVGAALLMGVAAGLGYITKAAFLPVSLFVFLATLLGVMTQSGTDRFPAIKKLAWFAPAMALLAIPYIIALSIATGHFTLGESGSLNYAWTVNHLTHWHWTGGPAVFGEPLHSARLLSTSPHVYEYGEPMHVTYPPLYNPYYWYEGYHHFFVLKNQIAAIKANLFALVVIFFDTPHAPVKAVVAIALLIATAILCTDRAVLGKRLLALSPVYLPSLLGIAMYVAVTLEVRYLVGFILVLVMMPLVALFVPSPVIGKRLGSVVLIGVSLLSLAYLIKDTQPAMRRALRNESYTQNEEWRIGLHLAATGIAPGTKVAMVKVERGVQTNWAFIAGLRVMGQIGNQDFTEDQQAQDFQLFIDNPPVQQTVFDLFRKSGAEFVVALDLPHSPKGDGWTQVPETKAWLHRL